MKVQLKDTYLAYSGAPISNFFSYKTSPRWYGLVAIRIIDLTTRKEILNDFHLLVCSQECKDKPFRKMPKVNNAYTLITTSLQNKKEINAAVSDRLRRINASDMDDFKRQMSQYFVEYRP